MIISCASVLESPRRGASNTLPCDFIIELLVIKEKPHFYDLVFCDNFCENGAVHVIVSSTQWDHHSQEYTRTSRTILAQKWGESIRHQPISDCRQMSESEWFTGETLK